LENECRGKTCLGCRLDNRAQDAKRDRAHRNQVARERYAAEPGYSEAKKTWILQNREKIADIWRAYRARKRARLGDDVYKRQNADAAQHWRDANPALVEAQNKRNKVSREYQYRVCFQRARQAKLEFKLSFDDYIGIVNLPCKYCATISTRGFNGVDREDSAIGYIVGNCVSCCSACNYMKSTKSVETLVRRAEHILARSGVITDGRKFPDEFRNIQYVTFNSLVRSAAKRRYNVAITEDDWFNIVYHDCYICGKSPNYDISDLTQIHFNGVDRYDNGIGYTVDNSRACCNTCNRLKRNYTYESFIAKLLQIYNVSRGTPAPHIGGDLTAAMPTCAPCRKRNAVAKMPDADNIEQTDDRAASEELPDAIENGSRDTTTLSSEVKESMKIAALAVKRNYNAEIQREFKSRKIADISEEEFQKQKAARKRAERKYIIKPEVVKPPAKTDAERQREWRERENAAKPPTPPVKTDAERHKEYREWQAADPWAKYNISAKIAAQRQREYRERMNADKTPEPPAKTSSERSVECRKRAKDATAPL
jgi:hypothetical protein